MFRIFSLSLVALSFVALSLVALLSFSTPGIAAGPLKALEGEKRVLLLFSKSRSDAQLDRQVDLLREYRSELRDHDLIVLRTSGNEETRSSIGYTPINQGMARQLLETYQPSAFGLTVVLVGKDGAEKKRWTQIVKPPELIGLIDSEVKQRTGETTAQTN